MISKIPYGAANRVFAEMRLTIAEEKDRALRDEGEVRFQIMVFADRGVLSHEFRWSK
jgi:hypothetical protein